MATTPEARFSRQVRLGLQAQGCSIERIENRVNLGIPDMLIGAGDRFVMLELKAVTRGLRIELRPHQVAFLMRHSAAGRPCFVLVHYAGTTRRPPFVSLFAGSQAMDLVEQGLSTVPLLSWKNRGVDWAELAQALGGFWAVVNKGKSQ